MSNDLSITNNKIRPIGPIVLELLERQRLLEESPWVGTEFFKEETTELGRDALGVALRLVKTRLPQADRAVVKVLLIAVQMVFDELVEHGKRWKWIWRATRRHPVTGEVLVASHHGLRGWPLLVRRKP